MHRPRWHGRPWSGAFNVVMATGIVSIASRLAGLGWPSLVLLWLSCLAFVALAASELRRARHPLANLRLARDLANGFAAFTFVAAACVVGTRIMTRSEATRVISGVLLGCGVLVWLGLVLALLTGRVVRSASGARGEWLLAVVASEGVSILAAHLASTGRGDALRTAAIAMWALGGALYLLIALALAVRLLRRPLRPGELTPDWWIVMGALAIFAVAAATLDRAGVGPARVSGVVAWALATAWIPVLLAAELWQARALGPPRWEPARWTMVFPLGMYSAAAQVVGQVSGAAWLTDLGRAWLPIALGAWLALAVGEVRAALRGVPSFARRSATR